MKKTLLSLFGIAGVLILVGGGCSATSPENKVQNLQEQKNQRLEESGYNECLQQIKEREDARRKCETDILLKDGYDDGIDCIGNYENPICDTGRYNAQVDASNECMEKFNDPNALTQLDCLELLETE